MQTASSLKPQRKPIIDAALTISAITTNLLMMGLPVALMLVYDRVIPNAAEYTLAVLAAGLVAIIIAEFLVRMLRSRLLNSSAHVAEHQQTMASLNQLLSGNLNPKNMPSVGDYLNRLRSIERIREYHSGSSESITVDLSFSLINLILIALIAGSLVLVPIAVLVGVGLVMWILSLRLRHLLLERVGLDNQRHDFLADTMSGVHLIRSLAIESLPTRLYERVQAELDRNLLKGARLSGSVQSVGIFGSQLVLVLFVGFGAVAVLDQNMTLGALAAGTMLSGRALQPLLSGVAAWLAFQRITLARDSLQELLAGSQDVEPESAGEQPGGAHSCARVEIRDLAFSYDPVRFPSLLEHLNLCVEPGEIVGITGANGSGKTTLLQLIAGLYKPSAGSVLIDGKPADQAAPGEVALLPQSGSLFRGTLGQNMSFFGSAADMREAVRIGDMLGLTDTIKRLPLGLDTPINGGHSAPLPDSVKQQILINRSLLGSPRLILVDEASSLLDASAERSLSETLKSMRGNATMIIVSNRQSLLSLCDRKLKLEDRILRGEA